MLGRHRHTWTLKGTAPAFMHGWGLHYHTPFLYICDICGKPKTKMVKGVWKLEDIASLSQADLDSLLSGS